jgi:alpha-mannosidase
VWDGELYLEMHRGTFTTKSELKRANRQLEFKLREVEILSVLRKFSGESLSKHKIKDIYKKFLINQFHDILPGSHIHPVYVDAMKDNQDVEEALDSYLGEGEGYFNSLNFKREEITFVEMEEWNSNAMWEKGRVCYSKLRTLCN